MKLYQTEQECGDGKNDWAYCVYAWGLLKHYLNHGASAYLYWNISLEEGGYSRWGWQQNSLITVDAEKRTYRWNPEYYLMKHLSHYVLPGARKLKTSGAFDDLMAFENADHSIVVVLYNASAEVRPIAIKVGNTVLKGNLEPESFNTLKFN